MKWYYLSFVHRISGRKDYFAGAVIVRAENLQHAVQVAWERNINPGGEVVGFEIPSEYEYRIEEGVTYRILSKEEIEEFDRKWSRLN